MLRAFFSLVPTSLAVLVMAGGLTGQRSAEADLRSYQQQGRLDQAVLEDLTRLEADGKIVELGIERTALHVVIMLRRLAGDVTIGESRAVDPVAEAGYFVAQRQEAFLQSLRAELPAMKTGAIEVTRRMEYQYALVARVKDRATLVQLLARPEVEFVHKDGLSQLLTVQGRQLTGSTLAAANGYTGDGVGVAVIDSWFDLQHAELGGSTTMPNGVVYASWNTVTGNATVRNLSFNDCYHGTGTAAIVHRYAPDADLYAVTVMAAGSGGVIQDSDAVAGINWCITKKNGLNGGAPIRIISMSLGGGRFYSAGSTLPYLYHSGCLSADQAGLVVIAASGNNGYTDSIGLPAASPRAISVGSVWDANNPNYSPFSPANCADANRQVDERTCYSNTAPFLDLYMPSEEVITARAFGSTWALGGTSSACPALAGLVAQLMDARPEYVANRAGIVSVLKATGTPVIGDSTKRRAYLPAAIDAESAPCFETRIGTNLNLGDDAFAYGVQLGFSFPWVTGATTNAIDICSNGFVYVFSAPGAHTNARYNATATSLVGGDPTIAAHWMDLNPAYPTAGGVFFNTFDNPKRAVITWADVPAYQRSGLMTVQLQLFENGTFSIYYDRRCYHRNNLIVGASPAQGVADPGSTDLSAAVPLSTGGIKTVYELFNDSNAFDLRSTVLSFSPNGESGWNVTMRDACPNSEVLTYGSGCPSTGVGSFYEWFLPGQVDLTGNDLVLRPDGAGGYSLTRCATSLFDNNYSAQLPPMDDDIVQNVPLGFTFPFPGGSTDTVDLQSNGYIYLNPNAPNDPVAFLGSISSFLSGSPRLSPFGMDLASNQGGAWYFDSLSSPSRALVTYVGVPEYNRGNSNTFQAQLFADGTVVFSYTQVTAIVNVAIVGFAAGGGSPGAQSLDLTGLPAALALGPATGSLPTLGTTLTMQARNVPASSLGTVMIVGLSPQALDLSVIGMTRCGLFAAMDSIEPMTGAPPIANWSMAVPNIPILIGGSLYLQAASVAPLNPFGIITSNGVRAIVGR